jgi:hypothetical protein
LCTIFLLQYLKSNENYNKKVIVMHSSLISTFFLNKLFAVQYIVNL